MKKLSKETQEDIEQLVRSMKKALPDTIEVSITVLIFSILGMILGLPINWTFFLVPRKIASCVVLIFTMDMSMRMAMEDIDDDLYSVATVHVMQAIIMALLMIFIIFFTGP